MKRISLIFLLGVLAFCGCKKSDQEKKDVTRLLTSKPWKLAKTDDNPSKWPTGNPLFYAANACAYDDVYTFADGGQLSINTGQDHCTAGEQQTKVQTFNIDTIETITINGTSYVLLEITATQLKYYSNIPGQAGYTSIVYVYQH